MNMLPRIAALSAALACAATAQDSKPATARQPMRLAPMPGQGGAPAPAQPSQADLIKKKEEKLALPVFQKAAWTFDFDKAKAEAKKSGKLIFTYFSRSYAH